MDARDLLEKYRQDRKRLVSDLRGLDALIRRLETDLGEAPDIPGEDISDLLKNGEDAHYLPPPPRRGSAIEPDEFFGMTHGEAGKKYLEMIGRAVSLEELVEVLNKGGCKVGGANPKRTLYISLIRNTRDFVSPQTGYIGLRKFYPQLKGKK